MSNKKKRGQRKADRMTKKVGEEFVLRYAGNTPAGWEVVRTLANGRLIRRIFDAKERV